MYSRLLSCCLIVVLGLCGCSLVSEDAAKREPPAGVHLYVEARAASNGANSVRYQGSLYSGGTETCENVSLRVIWAPELRNHVTQERWTTDPSRLAPGTYGEFTGDVSFDGASTPAAQLHAGLQKSRLRIECVGQDYAYELTIRLADAVEEAGPLLVDPQTLSGFALEANRTEPVLGGSRLVLAFRAADDRRVTISQAPLASGLQPPEESHETLTVRGHQAYLVTGPAGGESTLTWAEDGLLVAVSGNLDRAELVRIAEGLHR